MVDGRLRWWMLPDKIRLELNANWLAKGHFLRMAPNAPAGRNVRYLSIALSSQF
jgi:hypothetical protein